MKENGEKSTTRQRAGNDRPRWWAWLRLILLGITLTAITGTVMAMPLLPTGQVVLEEGDVAPEDLRAPRDITYESAILREEAQQQAMDEVAPVYTQPDPAYARQQLDRTRAVLDYLESVRADSIASAAQKREWIRAVPELDDLSTDIVDALLSLDQESWDRVHFDTLAVIDQAMRREIREGRVAEVRENIPALVSLDLSAQETAVVIALARRFLVPNAFLDEDATAAAREAAREQVRPVLRTFEANEIIVREGERVTALDLEALEQLGLRQSETRWTDFIGSSLLAVIGTSLFFLYLARFQPNVLWDGQQLFLLVLLTGSFVLVTSLMTSEGQILRYLAPAPALAMLATATLGPHTGVAGAIYLSGVLGSISSEPTELLAYTALGGVIAALTLGEVKRIGALFRAGGFAALAHIVVIAVFCIPSCLEQPTQLAALSLTGLANGGISASLALGALFLVGPLFDITTTIRLIELSRPDHPLLQRLLREAPATYHHSLMVANMAEQAAERIGADPLLTRVGAYYHDVGKLVRPYFFVENQTKGVNPHDRLDPYTSAEVIISHVQDGIELARRYRLPRRIRAFIPEHHGTNWISFLYEKAVEEAGDPELVDEDQFRYQGPKPQTKETVLVMLADGCEAAVRATAPANADEVAEVINRLIADRVADGQLNESDLTLRDLDIIRETFFGALKGVFHPRIKYPDTEIETKDMEEREKQTI